MSKMRLLLVVVVAAVMCGRAGAGVGDPQIMTNHPVYRGELSCSTLDRNIAEAYRVFKDRYGHEPKTDTEKVVALWAWKCEHYMHACDNKVYYGPSNPDANQAKDPPWLGRDGWMDNKDCQMNQFSFSFALCYSVHAQMAALVGHALGDMKRVRCPEITGHTPFEAFADGRWMLADCTMGVMIFDDDGKPVSLEDVLSHEDAKDKEWFASPKRSGLYKLNMSPFGDRIDGYSKVRWEQYMFGYNAMPIVYSLRPGESFTRYLDPGLEDGKTWMFWGRDYWPLNGKPKHGPYRNVTFLDDPPTGNGRKGRGLAYYGNGVFEYAPLADGKYKDGAKDSKSVAFKDGLLRGRDKGDYVIFEHVSPYVIAARPVVGGDRDWDVLKEKCRDGAVISGEAAGKVPVAVSVDGGRTWQEVGAAQDQFKIDFTDAVKGRHDYLVRFGLSRDDGLKALKMRTVVQAGRGVFPRLKDNGTAVTYQASGQNAIHGGPSQDLAERFRRKDLETDGVRVYQIKASGPIRSASGAASGRAERRGLVGGVQPRRRQDVAGRRQGPAGALRWQGLGGRPGGVRVGGDGLRRQQEGAGRAGAVRQGQHPARPGVRHV